MSSAASNPFLAGIDARGLSSRLRTRRAERIYHTFKTLVVNGAESALNLYVDVHRHDTDGRIQVATVGVSVADAEIIKETYKTIRDSALKLSRDVAPVD